MLSLADAEQQLFLGDLALEGFQDDSPRGCWLRAVGLGARGQYAAAWELLSSVLDLENDGADVSLAWSASASFHRQLGRHVVAGGLDEQALELALSCPPGPGALEAELDARIGLAADAVGVGDVALAAQRLEDASAVIPNDPIGSRPLYRGQIRLGWVEAEVALLTGDGERARSAATGSVTLARVAGMRRHLAKSLLFVGVGESLVGGSGHAAVREGLALAEEIGASTLVWPARSVLAGLEPDISGQHFRAAAEVISEIAAACPPPIAAEWMRAGDVSRIFTEAD